VSQPLRPRDAAEETPRLPDLLPVLPLKDAVLYPYIIFPLAIGRESAIETVDRALSDDRILALVAQRDPSVEEPGPGDLHAVGTAVAIMRMLKLPDGRIRILAQGVSRIRVGHVGESEGILQARVEAIPEPPPPEPTLEVQALVRSAKEAMDKIVGLGKNVSPEVLVLVANLEDPGRLADLIASNLELAIDEAQQVLETIDPLVRLRGVAELMHREIQRSIAANGSTSCASSCGPSRRSSATATTSPRRSSATARSPRREASRTRPRKSSSARSCGWSAPTPTPPRAACSAPSSTGSPACRGQPPARTGSTCATPGGCSTKTTTTSRRSRRESSSTSRCAN